MGNNNSIMKEQDIDNIERCIFQLHYKKFNDYGYNIPSHIDDKKAFKEKLRSFSDEYLKSLNHEIIEFCKGKLGDYNDIDTLFNIV
jgi:hypothetical protein